MQDHINCGISVTLLAVITTNDTHSPLVCHDASLFHAALSERWCLPPGCACVYSYERGIFIMCVVNLVACVSTKESFFYRLLLD